MTEKIIGASIWSPGGYDHSRYESRRRVLRFLLRTIGFTFLAKIDHAEGVEKVPAQGPAILMINHINFIDPFVVLGLCRVTLSRWRKLKCIAIRLWAFSPHLWGDPGPEGGN